MICKLVFHIEDYRISYLSFANHFGMYPLDTIELI